MSDTPRTDQMFAEIEKQDMRLIAGGNCAVYTSDAMESILEFARQLEIENAAIKKLVSA